MQSAAIPYRQDDAGQLEVLLITSRTHRRWIIPKGNVAKGMLPHVSAAREAEEEAGVVGTPANIPVGEYRQVKARSDGSLVPLVVRAFALAVSGELSEWPEKQQRERRWVLIQDAIKTVEDPEIRQLLRQFKNQQGKARSSKRKRDRNTTPD